TSQDSMDNFVQKFKKIHLKLAAQIEDIFIKVEKKNKPYYKPDTSKLPLAYILQRDTRICFKCG
ncbi:975_t:CDS:1, partial [Acaulospora morrowiae]